MHTVFPKPFKNDLRLLSIYQLKKNCKITSNRWSSLFIFYGGGGDGSMIIKKDKYFFFNIKHYIMGYK